VQHNFRDSHDRKPADKIQVDAELFLLALRSYPELFRQRPDVCFEQHLMSLVVAVRSGMSRAHATGR
jgi:hypothetical protein